MQRIPDVLEELGRFSAPVLDRAALERLLRLHRRTAIRLMEQLGGFQAGRTFLIDRERLIAELVKLAHGEAFTAERDRRTRLTDELEKARLLAPARKVRIAAAADVRERLLKDLPAGIHLRPGELRIEFFGADDLLRHLFELSQAMVNDYERFQKTVENLNVSATTGGLKTVVEGQT